MSSYLLRVFFYERVLSKNPNFVKNNANINTLIHSLLGYSLIFLGASLHAVAYCKPNDYRPCGFDSKRKYNKRKTLRELRKMLGQADERIQDILNKTVKEIDYLFIYFQMVKIFQRVEPQGVASRHIINSSCH